LAVFVFVQSIISALPWGYPVLPETDLLIRSLFYCG